MEPEQGLQQVWKMMAEVGLMTESEQGGERFPHSSSGFRVVVLIPVAAAIMGHQ